MANANHACDLDESLLSCALDLARRKDIFPIIPTDFGKRLIFQVFPRLAKAALTLENSTIYSRFAANIYNARPRGKQKKLGFSAAAIGIGEEGEEDEKSAREGKCEIVFGSPESWLITKRQ